MAPTPTQAARRQFARKARLLFTDMESLAVSLDPSKAQSQVVLHHEIAKGFKKGDGMTVRAERQYDNILAGEVLGIESEDEEMEDISDTNSDDVFDPEVGDGMEEEAEVEINQWLEKAVEFIENVRPEIMANKDVPALSPDKDLAMTAHPHQLKGAAVIERSLSSKFKGLIVADRPGLGKTLTALLAIKKALRTGHCPNVIVAPASCTQQWIDEIGKYFNEGSVKVLHLRDDTATSTALLNYDIVVASYNTVVSDMVKARSFTRRVAEYDPSIKGKDAPKRPRAVLLSGIWDFIESSKMGVYLVLDEAHTIKNTKGRTYQAIKDLRRRFISCVMLTGTPLDNTWLDAYALFSLLEGHPLGERRRMRHLFTDHEADHPYPQPSGVPMRRLIELMDAVTISRPGYDTFANLPECKLDVVWFDLHNDDGIASERAYEEFVKSKGAAAGMAAAGMDSGKPAWGKLFEAQHRAYHTKLFDIMALVRKAETLDNDDALEDEEEKLQLETWKAALKSDEAYRSPRVDAIVNKINYHTDIDLDTAVAVLDESIYFLDILDIALSAQYDPVKCYRYDGRASTAERHVTLNTFKHAQGPKVILCTRATGGQGLNMQFCNVLIRCGPWWKRAWEEQADARVFRPGQTRKTFIYEIRAKDCSIEYHKAMINGKKAKVCDKIMAPITLRDGALPRKMVRNFKTL